MDPWKAVLTNLVEKLSQKAGKFLANFWKMMFFFKKFSFSPNCSSWHVQCIFEKPVKSFSLDGRRNFYLSFETDIMNNLWLGKNFWAHAMQFRQPRWKKNGIKSENFCLNIQNWWKFFWINKKVLKTYTAF